MSLLIAGSVAIDNIITPHSKEDGLLGCSAAYAALAASLFTKSIHLAGVVGRDFPAAHLDLLTGKGIAMDSLERSEGESFTWTGQYHEDMNQRDTIKVGIN